jgi:dienelactone hydrolase
MSERNVNIDTWLQHLYDSRTPRLQFTSDRAACFDTWRHEFLSALADGMGGIPTFSLPLDPEITESHQEDGYTRHRLVLRTEPRMNVPCWLLVPDGIAVGEKRRGILALHGHGNGKDDVCGLHYDDEARMENIRVHNYDYARQFAQRGYVVIAPDHRGFGERAMSKNTLWSRDPCNVLLIKTLLFGKNMLMLNVWDAMKCLDYLQSRPDVDGGRLGAVGLSYGGTMTLFTTAFDPRVKAADIVCYMNSFEQYGLKQSNFCGNQTPSTLLNLGEMWDVAITIAPRPLLVESGIQDSGFFIEQSRLANSKVREAYELLGVADRFDIDEFDGGHRFNGAKAFDWFDRWL